MSDGPASSWLQGYASAVMQPMYTTETRYLRPAVTALTFKGRYRPESEARRSRLLRICRDGITRPSFWAKKRELLVNLERSGASHENL